MKTMYEQNRELLERMTDKMLTPPGMCPEDYGDEEEDDPGYDGILGEG